MTLLLTRLLSSRRLRELGALLQSTVHTFRTAHTVVTDHTSPDLKRVDSSERHFVEASFDGRVFSLEVVKAAAYRFTDRGAFDFRLSADEILCRLTFHQPVPDTEARNILLRLKNEVLDQDLRRKIAAETSGVRNAILAYALSGTRLQDGD